MSKISHDLVLYERVSQQYPIHIYGAHSSSHNTTEKSCCVMPGDRGGHQTENVCLENTSPPLLRPRWTKCLYLKARQTANRTTFTQGTSLHGSLRFVS
jgi:hypothetical protein